MRHEAVLIAGGGPAGSAAAIALATGGAQPLLLERTRAPEDTLCGGFLSWRSLERLERLGVSVEGHAVSRLRVFAGGRVGEAALPGGALGVSRRRLDLKLIERAARVGARVERGAAVSRAAPGVVTLVDGAEIACDALLLATGKQDTRGLPRPRDRADPALGLRLRLPAHPVLERMIGDAIELHLFAGGYAGLLLQEDGSANLCLAVRKSRLGGDPASLLLALAAESPPLAERLAFADERSVDAIGAVPYGWRATTGVEGLFRLGDQAAVIPSLAGEGMGIALGSGVMAARALQAGDGAEEFQRALARTVARPLRVAGLIRDLAEGPARRLAPTLTPWLASRLAAATRLD